MYVETDRLILRPFEPGDACACFAFLSDEQTCRDDGGYPPFTDMNAPAYHDLMQRFAQQTGRVMIARKSDGQVVGTVNTFLHGDDVPDVWEVGYVLAPAYRGQGYATEAVEAVLRQGFAQGVGKWVATAYVYNAASIRVLERLGFREEQTQEDYRVFILE